MGVSGDRTERAVQALQTALRAEHVRAGEPSTRAIAQAIGGMSHTTVNQALRGNTLPSWPILSKIVAELGGDIEEFRELWSSTRSTGAVPDRLPGPVPKHGGHVSVFVSYAHVDDEATFQRISKFVKSVGSLYESMTGEKMKLFMDTESIEPGDVWLDRIRLGISSSAILLAFVSPAYLRSAYCIEEYQEFASFARASANSRLVVPLLFAERNRIDRYFGANEVWAEIQRLQPVDLSGLRFDELGSPSWLRHAQAVVDRVEDVLVEMEPAGSASHVAGVVEPPAPSEQGSPVAVLEVMAHVEEFGGETAQHLTKIGALLERVGTEATSITPSMNRATTAKRRLMLARQFAKKLTPIAKELSEGAKLARHGMSDWDRAVTIILNLVEEQPDQLKNANVSDFFRTLGQTAQIGVESIASLEGFRSSIVSIKGYSRELDVPIKLIDDAINEIAAIRGTFSGWDRGLRLLKLQNDDV